MVSDILPPNLHYGSIGLNPCSNGIWSLTLDEEFLVQPLWKVLILVLMEYGL